MLVGPPESAYRRPLSAASGHRGVDSRPTLFNRQVLARFPIEGIECHRRTRCPPIIIDIIEDNIRARRYP